MSDATAVSSAETEDPVEQWLQSSLRRRWVFALAVVVVTLLAYRPALGGKFVWDDDRWTLGITGLLKDFSGLTAMWFRPGALMQYYPLVGTSFWLDYHFWGLWTVPYHVENILLHACAALLFWKLLERLKLPAAWLACLVFALHPVMVESVAWITERKNVLSLVFYLGCLLCYERYERERSAGRGRASYLAALALCLGALLSKTTAFSIPPVILLVAWWKRGRLRWVEDVMPSLPFFGLAIALGLVTAWVERTNVGASGGSWALSIPQRVLLAGRALWFYAGKFLWPTSLCFVYPRWRLDPGSLVLWLYPVSALCVLAGLWLARKRVGRGPVAVAFFYAGTLFPVLGFMNAYYMRYSFVADHWVYVSALGLVTGVVVLVARLAERWRKPGLLPGFAIMVVPVLVLLTWNQSASFQNMESLWRSTLEHNPNSFMPQSNLGVLLLQQGQLDEAGIHLEKALELRPDLAGVHNNYGYLLMQQGRVGDAIPFFRQALDLSPDMADAHMNLGDAWLRQGRLAQAVEQYQAALTSQPTNVVVLYKLCWVMGSAADAEVRNGHKAVEYGEKASRLTDAKSEVVLGVLAAAYAESGNYDEALSTARRAAALPTAQANSGILSLLQSQIQLYQKGQPFRDPMLANAPPAPQP